MKRNSTAAQTFVKMDTKILFKIPFTKYFLAYCRDGKYRWFSLYKKQFGWAKNSKHIKISNEYFWEEI